MYVMTDNYIMLHSTYRQMLSMNISLEALIEVNNLPHLFHCQKTNKTLQTKQH